MAGNRKAAEDEILTGIELMLPGSANTQMYKDLFAAMSDKDFDEFVSKLESKAIHLAVVAPNMSEPQLSVKRNLQIAKEKYKHDFFERIWIHGADGTPPYLTNQKYLVILLPLRRQAQLLTKKVSIPQDNRSVDDMTGQPTGSSKGSKLSFPEIQITMSHDLVHSTTELIKYRGGDIKGFDALNAEFSRSGGVSQKSIEHLGSTVKSAQSLSNFLKAMHLDNTLTD